MEAMAREATGKFLHVESAKKKIFGIYMYLPPVHSIQVPVTYADSGLARKSNTPAASCAVPGLPTAISLVSLHFFAFRGMPDIISCPPMTIFSFGSGGLVILVSIHPYAAALQRTPYLRETN
jgi:hypothetical protein